jgi:uncharacterized protein YidB (DUF937 family)
MGLLDILNTIQNTVQAGGGGVPQPAPGPARGQQSQGMSPIAKALLALLAVYAVKNMRTSGGSASAPVPPSGGRPGGTIPSGSPGGTITARNPGDLGGSLGGGSIGSSPGGGAGGGLGGGGLGGGGLGDMLGPLGDLLKGPLGGILGGTLGGAAAGTVLNGGLGDLLKQLQQSGQGDVVHSWVGSGANQTITPSDLSNALGGETLDQVSQETGLTRDQLLAGLSQHLPDFINRLTPNGRMPSPDEL